MDLADSGGWLDMAESPLFIGEIQGNTGFGQLWELGNRVKITPEKRGCPIKTGVLAKVGVQRCSLLSKIMEIIGGFEGSRWAQ